MRASIRRIQVNKVHIIDDGIAARLLFNEMVRVSKDSKNIKEMFLIQDISEEERTNSRKDGPTVDVVLTINGVEVDAVEVLTQSWKRMMKQYNDAVAKDARELVRFSGMGTVNDEINDILSQAKREIISSLQKKFPDMNFEQDY